MPVTTGDKIQISHIQSERSTTFYIRRFLFEFEFVDKIVGEFGFEDFVSVLTFRMREVEVEDDLQKAFRIFDRDGDGFITVKELRYLLTNLGERHTEEEVTEMIKEVDLNRKGKVDFHGKHGISIPKIRLKRKCPKHILKFYDDI